MHNVKRVPVATLSPQVLEQRRIEEEHRLNTYKQLEKKYLEHRERNDGSPEALDSTSSLLACNPEYYSAWNYRRVVLLRMFEKEEVEQKIRLLEEDLTLLQQSMRTHPKVYWLWNHRRWCLQKLPSKNENHEQSKWRRELALVDMMLEMDPRNFMGWNYRRWVVEELAKAMSKVDGIPPFPSSLSSELDPETRTMHLALAYQELKYTLVKIESDFSNFSAWHNRSKLLPRIWDGERLDSSARSKQRISEFELLQQAMFTDPSDQSIWIYHRWLVAQDPSLSTLKEQIRMIEELADLEPDSKWCLQSLAHYKQQILLRYRGAMSSDEATQLDQQVCEHLLRLEHIDPLRQNRYRDLLAASH